MAVSEVDYINIALGLVGENPIVAVTDRSKEARWAVAVWEISAKEIFDLSVNWKFCRARAELSALSDSPLWSTWEYQYALPDNCRRVQYTVDEFDDKTQYPYKREIYVSGSDKTPVILYNYDECRIIYTVYLSNVGEWPGWFAKCVYLNAAMKLCKPLTRDDQKNNQIERWYVQSIKDAKSSNGMEDVETDDNDVNIDQGNTDVLDAAGLIVYSERYVEETT